MNRKDLELQCFCYTTLLGAIFMEQCFREFYGNDLRTTTCSDVLGHRGKLGTGTTGEGGGTGSRHASSRSSSCSSCM
jgi:hypothetical protein